MSKFILATITFIMAVSPTFASPPSDEVMEKIKAVISKQCPDAKFETTKQAFIVKFDTMTYTLHQVGKAGEAYEKTYQAEGPRIKGFVLTVDLREGKYEGAASIPQTMQGPYYPTFIDAQNVGDKHHFVHFSYGRRLDDELKKAIMDVIPTHQFKTVPQRGR